MIGAGLTRREDERVLRGEGRFVDDIELPGLVHLAFVRSPVAHAGLVAVRVPDDLPGVVAVVSGASLAGRLQPLPVQPVEDAWLAEEPHPILALDEVRYAGQPVAAVVAQSRALAEDAAELVEVEYAERGAVVEAAPEGEPLMRWARAAGDVEGAFAAAAHVARGRYSLPRVAAVPIEARGCVASFDPGRDVVTVWCSAQDPHRPMAQLTHVLRRPRDGVRVIVPDVGGAFGSKGVIAPEVAVAAFLAIELRRPVKWTEDRYENFLAAYQGRGMSGELELALDGEGRMLGLRARLVADLGAYLLTTTAIPPHTAAMLLTGCYAIGAASVSVVGVRTNKVPTGPYRGAGRPEAAYMLECLVDDAARASGIDRVQLRRRNLIRRFPFSAALGHVYDSGDYEQCLSVALAGLGEVGRPAPECVRGSGVALFVERAGGGFESASIAAQPDGSIVVWSSSSPHGQGHETTFAQIAASRLGVGVERVRLRFGDSATSPAGVGTFGSRSVAMAGSAVALAAERLLEQGGGELRPGLRAEARFESDRVFSSGAYAAAVEIERATGRLAVLRIVAVDDAGVVINPLLAHGQVLGGIVQGLGECLAEEVVCDAAGQPVGASLLDYALLTAAEVPPIACFSVVSPSPLNPLGAKGVGEGGAIGTLAAVACAVADAIGRHVDPPFTSAKLWAALR